MISKVFIFYQYEQCFDILKKPLSENSMLWLLRCVLVHYLPQWWLIQARPKKAAWQLEVHRIRSILLGITSTEGLTLESHLASSPSHLVHPKKPSTSICITVASNKAEPEAN